MGMAQLFFFSITKKQIADSIPPPKLHHLILKCQILLKVIHNFCDAFAWGAHLEIQLHCPFLCTPIMLQSKNHTTQRSVKTMLMEKFTSLVQKHSQNITVPSIPVIHQP
jgi:hypothetical protein